MKHLSLFNELGILSQSSHEAIENQARQCLEIEGQQLKGSVKRTVIESGLILYDWQLTVLEPLILTYRSENEEAGTAFKLIYYFQPPPGKIRFDIEGEQTLLAKEDAFLLIYPAHKTVNVTINKTGLIICLAISVAYSWLDEQLQTAKITDNEALQEIKQWVKSCRTRLLSKGESVVARSLFTEMNNSALRIEVKGYVYNLIASLYRQLKFGVASNNRKNEYAAVLEKVEKRVMTYLTTNLPSLNDFAKEFFMSFSSLNRHFKKQYGVTIYDYYLQKKMELAKELLYGGTGSVKEVAMQLGYESPTHFISIFKKIHGYPPGQIKKDKQIDS